MVPVSQLLSHKGSDLHTLRPEDPVIDAIRLMADKGIGAVLVMQDGKLAGILSERDYARKVILMGRSSKDTAIATIMTPVPLVTVSSSSRTKHCMRLMTDRRIRHLPVVDGDTVVGMLSIGDIVRSMIETLEAENAQMKQYIAG
ncbi:MAG: CBS domain-containing protein [Xanthomonadales bacterium]|nr:Inosine-5'-monophosphate dehydrogenase [Xanthomonadales bacterium]MCC6592636.1 CBS domain-containing protein [Xanthomonadales bacterium]MCE7931777.1 CBS domain-containing protein [Xanthomonadales bacterium PRO6]